MYTTLSRIKQFYFIHDNFKELNNKHCNRKSPLLELTNSKYNSQLFVNGKINKVTFNDGGVYVGSTYEELKTRSK